MGLDFGLKHVGLALSVVNTKIIQPFRTIPNNKNLFKTIQVYVISEKVKTIVVGLPRSINGTETNQTMLARKFAEELSSYVKAKIVLQDEAVTSIRAKEILELSGKSYKNIDIDSTAAMIIAQDYIEQL